MMAERMERGRKERRGRMEGREGGSRKRDITNRVTDACITRAV